MSVDEMSVGCSCSRLIVVMVWLGVVRGYSK